MTWNPLVGKARGVCNAATGCECDDDDMARAGVVDIVDGNVVVNGRGAREGIRGLPVARVSGCRLRREAARKTRRENMRAAVGTSMFSF